MDFLSRHSINCGQAFFELLVVIPGCYVDAADSAVETAGRSQSLLIDLAHAQIPPDVLQSYLINTVLQETCQQIPDAE